MKHFFIILCLLFEVTYSAVSPDTALSVTINGRTTVRPFIGGWKNFNGVAFTEKAAIRGNYGMQLSGSSKGGSGGCELNFMNESWLRFYIRIDSVIKELGRESLLHDIILFPMGISVTDKIQPDQPGPLFQYELHRIPEGDLFKLLLVERNAAESLGSHLSVAIKAGVEYCIESRLTFSDSNIAHIMLFVNGDTVGSITREWYYPLKYLNITCTANSTEGYSWFVALDEFAVSDKRIFSIPPKPVGMKTAIDGSSCNLSVSDSGVDIEKQNIAISEWRLYSASNSIMPIFSLIEKAPQKLFGRIVPFHIYSGSYYWQVRFINMHAVSGDWSEAVWFAQKEGVKSQVIIKGCRLFDKPDGTPLNEIKAGEWYWFRVDFERSVSADSLLYFIVAINDSNYLLGHPGNKYGEYIPCHNFVYNISVGGNKIGAFERRTPNSTKSDKLQDNIGLYLDGKKANIFFDTVKNELRFRGRVIDSLQSRTWRLSATAYFISNYSTIPKYFGSAIKGFTHSSSYFKLITVVSSDKKTGSIPVVIVLVLVFAPILFFHIKRRKITNHSSLVPQQDREYEMVVGYVKTHLADELSANIIRNALHFSYGRFYEIMNRNKKKLPHLINEIRVNRAKELILANPDKNFEEIGYMIGIKNSSHFYRIFKDITGKTPKEYKISVF